VLKQAAPLVEASLAQAPNPERSAAYAAAVAALNNHGPEFARVAANYAVEALSFSRESFEAMLDAYSRDAEILEQRTGTVTLATSQLWPGRLPAWVMDAWDQLKHALLAAGDDWLVWTDWYEERLKGRPGNQAVEIARASIPNQMWERGPDLVNAHIRELFRQHGISRYEITNAPEIVRQLAALTKEELAIIGVRVALRVVPLIEPNVPHFLFVLRAISSAWTATRYQLPADHSAHAKAVYTDLSNSHVELVSQISDTLLASADATELPATVPYVIKGIDAFREATFRQYGKAGAAVFDLALSQDLNDLRAAPDIASVAELPIWLGDAPPEWATQKWESLKQKLFEADTGWAVWLDWYEDRIAGTARSKARELAYVEVPHELWPQGPATLNAWILNRIYELEGLLPPTDIPQLPKPGPGPRFLIGEGGLIDRAPLSDVGDDGSDARAINQLRPLVQRCASDLQARLSRNEFPELLVTVEQYSAALNPSTGLAVNWGEVWGLGVMLQNAAFAAERHIAQRLLPPLEDPAKTSLDSLLALHGPLILATSDGSELSAKAQAFAMTREQQADLRAASAQVAEQLKARHEVITPPAASSVGDAVNAIGEGNKHPERGSVYGLATIRNLSIVLIGGAAVATPTVITALLGPLWGALSAPFTFLAGEAVRKNPTFIALATQLGAKLDVSVSELRTWLEERGRRLAPLRSFVIANEKPLRTIAQSTPELKWMLRYIDFVVGKEGS
jgi:hypothetical protein